MEEPEVDGVDFCVDGGRPRPRGVVRWESVSVVGVDVESVVSIVGSSNNVDLGLGRLV